MQTTRIWRRGVRAAASSQQPRAFETGLLKKSILWDPRGGFGWQRASERAGRERPVGDNDADEARADSTEIQLRFKFFPLLSAAAAGGANTTTIIADVAQFVRLSPTLAGLCFCAASGARKNGHQSEPKQGAATHRPAARMLRNLPQSADQREQRQPLNDV